jgi:hypothetical protein
MTETGVSRQVGAVWTFVALVAAFCLNSLSGHATLTINTEAVKKSTVFIYPADASGGVDPKKPDGTGFLVLAPRQDGKGSYILLLTARHVLNPTWAGCLISNPRRIYLRMNLKAYDPAKETVGTDFEAVDLLDSNNKEKYATSSDPQVDAAVIILNPAIFESGKYDATFVPISVFATDEELKALSTGDSVVSAGLLPSVEGRRRNYPAFKFGAISDVRDEPFYTGCGLRVPDIPEKVWFVAINLFPGASGSAIFYVPPGSGNVQFGAPIHRPVLIGIQSSSLVDADIAAMTPIGLVFPIIESSIESLQLPKADLRRGTTPSENKH